MIKNIRKGTPCRGLQSGIFVTYLGLGTGDSTFKGMITKLPCPNMKFKVGDVRSDWLRGCFEVLQLTFNENALG